MKKKKIIKILMLTILVTVFFYAIAYILTNGVDKGLLKYIAIAVVDCIAALLTVIDIRDIKDDKN